MPKIAINCVYCGTPNYCDDKYSPKTNLIKKILSDEKPDNTSEIFVVCGICKRKYHLTQIGNLEFWKKNLNYIPSVLEDIKRHFNHNDLSLEDITRSLTGVVRDEKKKYLHICFNFNGKLGYFDCMRSKDNKFNLISVFMI